MIAFGAPRPRGFRLLFSLTPHHFFLFLIGTLANKLNVPQVLLPFSREPGRVPFLLEAQRGCYIWHSTQHDAVAIQPLYENGTSCSQRAVLVAESTQPIRLSSIILAREVVTDHELRCDVKVDVIDNIEIVSRTRELYVDDAPLELMVRALDSKGNTFSTLAGMVFEWSIAQDKESSREELSSKIRILNYSEAEYSPPDYITEMEKEEKQGDVILVSGMRTGAAVVKVRIHEPFYKKVAAALIRLLVLENIFLIPSHDTYLLVGAYMKYRVAKMVQGRMTEGKFPLEHYTLELQDHRLIDVGLRSGTVALLDEKTAMVTALQLGQTNLVFVHKNVHMRSVSGLPNSTIYVVEPGFLGFTIHPGGRWSLEVGQVYIITVEVFDKSSTRVYISDNLKITFQFSKEYFEEQLSTLNGSYHMVKALKDGAVVINASLTSSLWESNSSQPKTYQINHQQEVKIYFPIQLKPSFLAFPHYPLGISNRFTVQVEGGSGNFTWSSSNETVAMVTTKGVVTAGQVRGNSTILARDVQNPFRSGNIKVYVMKLNKMELLPFQADVEIGQIIEVPIAMYHVNTETKEAIAFTDCSHLPLDLNSDKQGVFTLFKEGIQKPGPMHCSSVHIAATSPGHTLVTISVTGHEEHVWSSATFAAYEPLKALNPVEVALVTWHSVKEMVFEGGPHPWILEPSRFFLELSMEKAEAIRITEVRLPAKRKQNQYVYRVLCLELGEQVLTLRIGNHPGVLNPSPSVEKVQVRFICAHPASMLVTPMYKVPAGTQPCPLPQYNKQLIPVSSVRDTVLELAVFDQHGRKFDNFSSLMLEWKSSNETLARFESPKSVEMVARDDGSGQTRLHGHQILEVHQIKGTVLIGVNFAGYSGKRSPKGISNSPRSAGVELLLVEDVTVQPENATIYNHPDVKEVFNLVEGSGYFLVNSSEQDIVTTTYMESEGSVQLVPAHPGFLTLKVYDLCLAYLGPAMAQVRVSDIQEVELDLIDKVEIGKTVLVVVRVLGSSKHPFRNKYFRNMDVRLQLASAIVTLRLTEDQDEYSENYMLRAVTVGQTTLVAIATDRMGRKFTSAPRHIEVFLQLPAENNFAMVVHTKAAGRTTIKVTVRSKNSSFGQFERNVLELSDEIQILVFEKLQLFYADCQREQILMPMNSQLKLHTNREGAASVSSRVLKCFPNSSVIEEDGEGLLRSGSIAGTAVLEVTSIEPFGVNQTTVTGVQATPVTYLRLSSYPKLYTAQGRTLSAFPLGMSLTFIVEFYNNIGEKFHTHNTRLYMALNRDDLLLIGPGNKNYTYMAQAVNKGVTVVGLWDQRHPGMADYIPVAVEHAIEPDTKLISVGDVICFSTQLVSQHGEPGVWMISTNNIIQTDTVTGVGVARSPGTATIFHDIPGVVKTFREVVVNASSRLTLSYDLKTYLTNTPNATVFKLFISTGRSVNLKGSCTPSQALAVEKVLLPETLMLCHVQFSNTLLDIPASKVFHIYSEFSVEKGVYVCLIKVRQESEELRQVLSVADTSVYGWATLLSERGKNGMQRILIPFIPGFYMNQSEFVLGHKDTGELRILGVERVLESLEVFHSSPFLTVSGHKHSTLTTSVTLYLIRIVNFTAFQQMSSPAFINVSCALTNQHEAVVVRAKDVSGADHCEESGVFKNFVGSYQILLFTLFAVLASTAFIFLAYNAFLNKVQTIPVVYVPTIGPTQPGSYTATCSPPHFLSSQPPLVQSRLQHWLWSIKH
uniref:Nucleoporin 210-like n=1 Tax=Rattus norvegicus TaxID=10116 RepID=A0ABK0LFU2_RAT